MPKEGRNRDNDNLINDLAYSICTCNNNLTVCICTYCFNILSRFGTCFHKLYLIFLSKLKEIRVSNVRK